MVMSVGVCECGCSEFGHDVGGLWEELGQPEYEGWQQHRCTKECLDPCLVARCRDGFDGDGFWVWCRECDIQCSGSYEEWSDEANEDGIEAEETSNAACHSSFGWDGLTIGSKVRVNFSAELLTITDFLILGESGDPIRTNSYQQSKNYPKFFAAYARNQDATEVLLFPDELQP